MWQDDEDTSPISTAPATTNGIASTSDLPAPSSSLLFPATESEPSSPRPSATLPSSTLPITFPAHPTYTIGTKSHSYATDHLKSIPSPHLPASPSTPMAETDYSHARSISGPASPPASPSRPSIHRTSSLQRVKSPASVSEPIGQDGATEMSLPSSGAAASTPLRRQSSLSLSLNRQSSLTKAHAKQQQQQDRDVVVPSSPSSTHRPQKHVMLSRRSISQDFQLRLQQQQQRQEDLGEELSEAGEDHAPGTPSSVSSFGSGTMGISGGERERDKSLSGRHNRSSRNSVALIESRTIQTLSSNLAMVSSPTDSEFPQQDSDTLLSVIAQKESRIALLREDLETNLTELTQLKERWSQMMIEERSRQQAEASASIQEQERQLYGHSSTQSVSHRLSTTGAGIWGSVVGSVSGISGVSGGISLHNINASHQQNQHQPSQAVMSPGGLVSGRSSTSSRPTSPLPAYLSGFSSLNGLNSSVSPVGHNGVPSSSSAKNGDRTSLSSLSTCSSSQSNAGDSPAAFEAGHSSQSSISSAGGHPDQGTLQSQLHKEQRAPRRVKRESSGMFMPSEAEDVLVNTGRALFKGFGSLIGGIRTVVSDVAESDRFQQSRQRTLDMMSGLAQSAADALPLPSHDDIYYHHQRLRLLDEEEEEQLSAEQQQLRQHQLQQSQQAKEQRRRERQKEKERKLMEKAQSGSPLESSGMSQSPSLVRRSSRRSGSQKSSALTVTEDVDSERHDSLSKSVDQLMIREEPNVGHGSSTSGQDDEESLEWNIEDKELLESLEADVRGQEKGAAEMNAKLGSGMGSPIDTPTRTALEPSTTFALASKKND